MYFYRKPKLSDLGFNIEDDDFDKGASGPKGPLKLPPRSYRLPKLVPDSARSPHDMVPFYTNKKINSVLNFQPNAWNICDPAIRQLSKGLIKRCQESTAREPTTFPVKSSAEASAQLARSCGYSNVPRLRAYSEAQKAQKEALDVMWDQYDKSTESARAFSEEIRPFRRLRQPKPRIDLAPVATEANVVTTRRASEPLYAQLMGPQRAADRQTRRMSTDDFGDFICQLLLTHLTFYGGDDRYPSVSQITNLTEFVVRLAITENWDMSDHAAVSGRVLAMALDPDSVLAELALCAGLQFTDVAHRISVSAAVPNVTDTATAVKPADKTALNAKNAEETVTTGHSESKDKADEGSLVDVANKSGISATIAIVELVVAASATSTISGISEEILSAPPVATVQKVSPNASLSSSFEFEASSLLLEAGNHDAKEPEVVLAEEMIITNQLPTFSPAVRRRLLKGKMEQLPVIQSRVIRLFLSSNFSDMKNERNRLLRDAVPKLQIFAHISGLQMQMVDLRWGVSEDMALDPGVPPVCIEQIDYSRLYSSGPFFAVLLGDRYGNQALSQKIPEEHFKVFSNIAKGMKIKYSHLLEEWYELDKNAIPPVYILKPINTQFKNYGMMDYSNITEQLRRTATRQWFTIEQRLRDIIEKVSNLALDEQMLSGDVVDTYSMSLTETEIRAGMMTANQTEMPYCVCYARHIDGLELHLNEELAPKFIDITERNNIRTIDHAKQRRLEDLKASLEQLKATLLERRSRMYEAQLWENPNEPQPESEDALMTTALREVERDMALKEQEGRIFEDPLYLQQYIINWDESIELKAESVENGAFLTAENEVYLVKMTEDFVHDCKELIISYFFDKYRIPRFADRLEEELVHQLHIVNSCVANTPVPSTARQVSALDVLLPLSGSGVPVRPSEKAEGDDNANISSESTAVAPNAAMKLETQHRVERLKELFLDCSKKHRPLIIHGSPGSGRTALASVIAHFSRVWLGSQGAVIAFRALGTSRASSTIEYALSTVCHQITEAYGLPTPQELFHYDMLHDYFTTTLSAIAAMLTDERCLVLIFDGLDHLHPTASSHGLTWLPRLWPNRVSIVFTTDTANEQTMHNLNNHVRIIAHHQGCTEQDIINECFYEVQQLDGTEQSMMIDWQLKKHFRTISDEQRNVVLNVTSKNPQPLYIAVLMKDVVSWTSDFAPDISLLARCVEVAVIKKIEHMEKWLGHIFVSHTLSYITVDEGGISEVELEDVLSCDDEVLEETFLYVDPPLNTVIRIPQMFIARLRYYLGWYLGQVFDYGVPVFFWSHHQIASAVRKKYLLPKSKKDVLEELEEEEEEEEEEENGEEEEEEASVQIDTESKVEHGRIYTDLFYKCNRNLADLFYAKEQICRTLRLPKRHITIDDVSRGINVRPLDIGEQRKLQKLPIFLYNSGPEDAIREEFKQKVACNTEWMLTKLTGRPYQEVLDDFDQIKEKDIDIRMVDGILRASHFLVDRPHIFQLEVLSRFSQAPNAHSPVISEMVQEAWLMATLSPEQLLLPFYPCVNPFASGVHRARIGPTHVVAVSQKSESSCVVVVWGPHYGLSIWHTTKKDRMKLEPVCHMSNKVQLENVVMSADGAFAFLITQLTFLTKWNVESGKAEWEANVAAPIAASDGKSDQYAVPMALSKDNSLLVVCISHKKTVGGANESSVTISSGLVVVDVDTRIIVGTVGSTVMGAYEFVAEFVGDTHMVMVTCTYTVASTSTVYLYDYVPAAECSASFELPSVRNPKIPCVCYNDHLFFGCSMASFPLGDIVVVNLSERPLEVTAAAETVIGSSSDAATEKLISFAVTHSGLLVAIYNKPQCAALKIKDVTSNDWQLTVNSQEGTFVSCMTLAANNKSVYIGYMFTGVIENYLIPTGTRVCSVFAHSGDVTTVTELWPGFICSSGTDSNVRILGLLESTVFISSLQPRAHIRRKPDEILYNEMSQGIVCINRINCPSDSSGFRMFICSLQHNGPMLATLQSCLAIHLLNSSPNLKIVYFNHAQTALDHSVVLGFGALKDASETPASGIVVTWNMATKHEKPDLEPLFADAYCVATDGRTVGVLRKTELGCRMLVCDINTHRSTVKFNTGRRTDVTGILLTADNHFMITIDPDYVVVFKTVECESNSYRDYLLNSDDYDDLLDDDDDYYDESNPNKLASGSHFKGLDFLFATDTEETADYSEASASDAESLEELVKVSDESESLGLKPPSGNIHSDKHASGHLLRGHHKQGSTHLHSSDHKGASADKQASASSNLHESGHKQAESGHKQVSTAGLQVSGHTETMHESGHKQVSTAGLQVSGHTEALHESGHKQASVHLQGKQVSAVGLQASSQNAASGDKEASVGDMPASGRKLPSSHLQQPPSVSKQASDAPASGHLMTSNEKRVSGNLQGESASLQASNHKPASSSQASVRNEASATKQASKNNNANRTSNNNEETAVVDLKPGASDLKQGSSQHIKVSGSNQQGSNVKQLSGEKIGGSSLGLEVVPLSKQALDPKQASDIKQASSQRLPALGSKPGSSVRQISGEKLVGSSQGLGVVSPSRQILDPKQPSGSGIKQASSQRLPVLGSRQGSSIKQASGQKLAASATHLAASESKQVADSKQALDHKHPSEEPGSLDHLKTSDSKQASDVQPKESNSMDGSKRHLEPKHGKRPRENLSGFDEELRYRYLLKLATSPKCVQLSTERFLYVGTFKGNVIMFDLNVLEGIDVSVKDRPFCRGRKRILPPFVNLLSGMRHHGPINQLCLSPSVVERYLVTASSDCKLKVYDRLENDCLTELVGHGDQVLCACITMNDLHVVSGSADCTIRLWQLRTGIILSVFDACVDIYSVVVYQQDDHDSQLRIAALADTKGSKKLMLFRSTNVITSNYSENF